MSKRASLDETENVNEAKKASPAIGKPINMMEWIEENKGSFLPPVCNKLMYGAGQLKIMFIGGPNTRKDHHLEEGEELFFQIKGDMCLNVIEKGKPKKIPIKEGEMFFLPSRIQHSPQRKENTVGLVIERERLPDEMDALRYFCEDGDSVLWEKWFHCYDLGTQLGPVIKEYFASDAHKTGKPDPSKISKNPPLKVDHKSELMEPFSFKKWLKDNESDYKNGSKTVSESGEFKINIHGGGEQEGHSVGETWLWQLEGTASLTVNDITRELKKNDVIIIPAGSDYTIKREDGSVGMSVIMDPMANK